MNKQLEFGPHIIAVSALFVLGNGGLIFPKAGAGQFGFTAYIISVILLLILYICVGVLWDKFSADCGKTAYTVLLSVISVFALFVGSESISSLADFIGQIMLPSIPKFFIFLLLGITVIYFALKRVEGLLKFSLISFALAVVVILFFFVGGADKYELRNIFVFRLPRFSELLSQIKPYIANPVLQGVILPVFLRQSFGTIRTKQGSAGVILGAVLLGICILSPILLFGAALSGSLDFPFASLVSTITVGRLFTRLDGFAYFVFFVSAVIKSVVCLKVALEGLKTIDKRLKDK